MQQGSLWKKLYKNKTALVGMFIIALAVFVAIFGYLLAPDNTIDADLQTVEIQSKSFGYTQQFLKIANSNTEKQNLSTIFFGKKK